MQLQMYKRYNNNHKFFIIIIIQLLPGIQEEEGR